MENKFNNDFIERITNDGVGMLFVKQRYKLDEAAVELLSRIKNKGFKLVYVTSGLPYKSIQEKLDLAKINDYFIIDSVTAPIIQDTVLDNKCIFIKSPGDLTEISINLENLLKKGGETFVVIDSITSFLIYNSENEILRFIHFTSSIAREEKSKLVFIVIENNGISKNFLDKIRSFIDEEAVLD
jgi:archaellum biogenesis ATPase FlaH